MGREEPKAKTATPNGAEPADDTILVVGLGASAGGLEVLKEFFAAVPKDPGVAFAVIQHLDPKHESMMPSLLSKYSPLAATQIEDGMAIAPNAIYIIPPNHDVAVDGNRFRLTEQPADRRASMPIDFFFRSLAKERREKAIGVVLSGTMSDGTLGIRAIKEQAGMVMAQDPREAPHDGMPRSAIATGMVDFVLPVREMPEALLKYVRHSYVNGHGKPRPEEPETKTTLQKILALVKTRSGNDFRFYKKSTLVRRIERRMGVNQIETVEDYLEHLREDDEEAQSLAKDLRIGVTSFFRDPEAWELLKEKTLPRIFEGRDEDAPVRVWVPGCSTGEEAYTLLMLLFEHMDRHQVSYPIQMFATDIDEEALATARQGVYPKGIAADVSEERLARFFVEEEDHYRVKKRLREAAVFVVQNVFSDAPFSNLDLISCRNLLIYLESEIQQKILSLFHFSLRDDGGYLFLGSSETIGSNQDLFRRVSKKWRVYERIGPHISNKVDFPIASRRGRRFPGGDLLDAGHDQGERLERTAQAVLLRHYTPAAVVVNRAFEIQYLHGPLGDFLDLPQGSPRLDLGTMVKDGLRAKLRSSVHRAMKQNQAVHVEEARVRRDGHYRPCRIDVRPLRESKDFGELFLVVFQDVPLPERPAPSEASDGACDEALVRQLEQELDDTRQELQNSVEEYETANEELKASNEEVMSMNEELQASNEELETSKEELQSLNEELTTVNAQLQDKVQELEAAHADLRNLMESTRIPTLFLDAELQIRRFTPASVALFHLRESDVGRPIRDLSQRFADGDLEADAREVLRTLAPVEREVRSEEGTWFQRRILPFRTETDHIAGVVITFVDVTRQKEVAETLRESEQRHRIMGDIIPYGTWLTDAAGKARYISPSWLRMVGKTFEEVQEFGWLGTLVPEEREEVERLWEHSVATGEPFEHEHHFVDADGKVQVVLARGLPVQNDEGEINAWAGINLDITDRKAAEEALREAKEEAEAASQAKANFLANMSHEIRTPLSGIIGATDLLGHSTLDPDQRRHLETIQSSGELLLDIVDDVLDFSKIEAGHLDMERVPFPLRTTVEEAVYLLAGNAHRKGLELACLVAEDVPERATGDPGRFQQVLLNLVGNAVKFTERGEVIVRVEAVTVAGDRPGVRCEVSDTGVGIPEEICPEMFQSFTQADASTSRRFGGTGLGLAISKRLVEAMGGEIGFTSTPGEGSTFWFTLPIDPVPEQEGRRRGRSELRGLRALVVDDHSVTCEFFGEQLGRLGIEVACVTSADEARTAAETAARKGGRFDFFFVDVDLPGTGGVELARRLAAESSHDGAHVVLLSPVTARDEAAAACEDGATAYLVKPIREHVLADFLAALLSPDRPETPSAAHPRPAAEPSPRLGGPVLLAEDNPVNRRVVEAMLRKLGQEVETVADGRKAVEACLRNHYALVLMDWQMPGLDGLDAAREIRAREPDDRRTPIVALTANAMSGDRTRCLDAGMDDYLAKPLTLESLARLLRDVAAQGGGNGGATLAGPAAPPSSSDGLAARLARFREALSEEQLASLVRLFLDQTPSTIAGVEIALRERDFDALAARSHSLKGSCAQFGSDAMVRACAELEEAGPETPDEELAAGVERLRDEFDRVKAFLEGELGEG